MSCFIYEGTKLIVELNYNVNEFKKEWYPDWKEGMQVYPKKFEHPVVEEDNLLREKTREERILMDDEVSLLQVGEKVEDGQIIKIECNDGELVTPRWNFEEKKWEEGANKESLILERKDKLLQYKKIQEEIKELKELEEIDETFASPEAIELLTKKLSELKKEITILFEKIKKL